MGGPLHGLRAIDLTDALGHLCRAGARRPRRRGDQVEPPGGDPSRRLPPRHRAPDGREHGLYWYATNLGKWGNAQDITVVLTYKDRIYAIMEQVYKLDTSFFYGAADRYFGAYYAIAPSFAGGDLDRSLQHFDATRKIEPRYLLTDGKSVFFRDDGGELIDLLRAHQAAFALFLEPLYPKR